MNALRHYCWFPLLTALCWGLSASSASAAPPAAVDLYTPANSETVTNRRPEFSWSSSEAPWYYVWVSRNGSKCLDTWVSGGTTWIPESDLAGGNYTWWVRPWNSDGFGPWSVGSTFTIPVAIPGTILAINPQGVTVSEATQKYFWEQDAAATWYEVYVSRNGKLFSDQWYSVNDLANMIGYVVGDFTGYYSGNYQWWVRGWSPDGMGPWSSGLTFNISSTVPGIINLVSPSGSLEAVSTQSYCWQMDACAHYYELCIYRNGKLFSDSWYHLTNSVLESSSGMFAVNVSGHHGGTYQWWVRGWSPDGMGAWSTNMTATVPSNPPLASTLLSPLSGVYLSNPLFTWTAVDGAEWYQLYIRKGGAYYYSTWLQGTNWQASWDITADPGDYEWSIAAWNPDGLGPWTTATFRGGPMPPGQAWNLRLENIHEGTSVWCNLVWNQSDPPATDFYIEVSYNGQVWYGQWSKTTWVTTGDLPSGNYSWRVMTRNAGGNGTWSETYTFVVYNIPL